MWKSDNYIFIVPICYSCCTHISLIMYWKLIKHEGSYQIKYDGLFQIKHDGLFQIKHDGLFQISGDIYRNMP